MNELVRQQAAEGFLQRKPNFVKIGPLALDSAQLDPYVLPSPMKAFFVQDATDSTTEVKLLLNDDGDAQKRNALPVQKNFCLNFEEAIGISYLTWDAQPGKTITIYIAINANITSGKMISVGAGGTAIDEGDTLTPSAYKSVLTTATLLSAANSDRKKLTIQNQGVDPIFIGNSAVTINTGILPGYLLQPGETKEYKNTAAIYAIASAVNAYVYVLEES